MLRAGSSGNLEGRVEHHGLANPDKTGPAHGAGESREQTAGQGDGAPTPVALARMVEGEIIPRLLLAHRGQAARPDRPALEQPCDPSMITADCILAFAKEALGQDSFQLLSRARGLLADGMPMESLLLDLFAPTARKLGEWWEDDVCDFVDVTMGLWRLQEVLHEISAQSPADHARSKDQPGACFALMPGDTHGFATLLLEEVFRQSGWRTTCQCNCSKSDLEAEVAANWYDVIGLTVCVGEHMSQVTDMVAALRASSQNPEAILMVGGFVFNTDPKLVGKVGADATAPDARAAVELAEHLLQDRANCRPLRQAGRM